MKSLRVVFTLLILVVGAAQSKSQDSNAVKNLSQVSIVVEGLDEATSKIGLTKDMLASQALVAIKKSVPKIIVKDSATSHVYIRVIARTMNGGCVAHVTMMVQRPVTILADDGTPVGASLADVWEIGAIPTGKPDAMASKILERVDRMVVGLAADYYKANP